jgi:hypothetical protein
MPKRPDTTRTSGLQQDPLIDALGVDPTTPTNLNTFTGLVGRSAKPGHWRIYTTLDLDEYLEFEEKDVVHSRPIRAGESPIGGTIVWLRAGASVEHSTQFQAGRPADFLSGEVASHYAQAASPASYTPLTTIPCGVTVTIRICVPVSMAACPSSGPCTALCWSQAACPTKGSHCDFTIGKIC